MLGRAIKLRSISISWKFMATTPLQLFLIISSLWLSTLSSGAGIESMFDLLNCLLLSSCRWYKLWPSPPTEETAQPESAPIGIKVKPHSQKARNKTKSLLIWTSSLKGHNERTNLAQIKPWKITDWKKEKWPDPQVVWIPATLLSSAESADYH